MILSSHGVIASQIASFVGLLDLYPNAAAAYSVRKLRTAYTGSAIRVRRSSDNTEQDIGFSGGNLDTTALTSFCSGTNGFVTTWYDQSGNARNATQTTAANQPQIVNSGSVIVENGNPNIFFNGTSNFLLTANSVISTDFSVYAVAKTPSSGSSRTGFLLSQYAVNDSQRTYFAITRPTDLTIGIQIGSQLDFRLTNQNFVQQLYYWNRASSSIEFAENNTSVATGSNSTTCQNSGLGFGGFQTGARSLLNIQEVIAYNSDQSSNRTGISSNINTYYGIY
jgi:hypothetical protein